MMGKFTVIYIIWTHNKPKQYNVSASYQPLTYTTNLSYQSLFFKESPALSKWENNCTSKLKAKECHVLSIIWLFKLKKPTVFHLTSFHCISFCSVFWETLLNNRF
jgi:hypothetical protein